MESESLHRVRRRCIGPLSIVNGSGSSTSIFHFAFPSRVGKAKSKGNTFIQLQLFILINNNSQIVCGQHSNPLPQLPDKFSIPGISSQPRTPDTLNSLHNTISFLSLPTNSVLFFFFHLHLWPWLLWFSVLQLPSPLSPSLPVSPGPTSLAFAAP